MKYYTSHNDFIVRDCDGLKIPKDTLNTDYKNALQLVRDGESQIKEFNGITKDTLNLKLMSLDFNIDGSRCIQTRPIDEQNIRNAIEKMERDSVADINWRLKDNTVKPVTIDELRMALVHGQNEAAKIWEAYNLQD